MRQIELNENEEKEFNRQLEHIQFGTVEITPLDEFSQMLKYSIKNNKPLRVKCGIDPTNADIHLGHLVPYKKMRDFQDLGHIGVVIIGDYTAQIGDPTGRNESRKHLTPEEVKKNAEKYMEQIYTVLDPKKTEIRYQTEWYNKSTLLDVLNWASTTTVAKLMSHETFKVRLEEGQSLGLHELMYPVLQGIDSVEIQADVELGGTDQKFNVLMGRDYQKNKGQRQQVAILTPIVTGLCGKEKMSKSLGNYIGILDEPFDKFGKVMSIPDEIMVHYYEYLSFSDAGTFKKMVADIQGNNIHPNEAKKQLATRIVSFFHGEEMGQKMRLEFEKVFKKKDVPDEVDEFTFERGQTLLDVMVAGKMVSSKSDARRMFKQNAVSIVGEGKISDASLVLSEDYVNKIIKVGKRKFLKLI